MPEVRSKTWIVIFTVFFPLIYVPVAFVAFFGISWLLAVYVFASQPLPFQFFAFAGVAIGVLLAASNAWRARKPLVELFSNRSSL